MSWEQSARNDSNSVSPMSSGQSRSLTTLPKSFRRSSSSNHSNPLNQEASGSSTSSNSEVLRHNNPIALTILIPQERMLRETCTRKSFELEPTSSNLRKSKEHLRNFSENRTYTEKSSFIWPFHHHQSLNSNQLLSKEPASNSLPEAASKFRVVGRGGSGSRLRRASSSIPPVSAPNVSHLRQPSKSDFYRPGGRGGLGSSTRPLSPLKPPTAVLGLLGERKQSQAQRNARFKSPEAPLTIRTQASPTNIHRQFTKDSFAVPNHSGNHLDERLLSPSPSATFSTLGRLGPSISQNSGPNHNNFANSATPNERRQRSLNKLARTLGAPPPALMEGVQSGPVSKSSVTFNNFPDKDPESLLTDMSDIFIGPRTQSYHSLASSTITDSGFHQFDLPDDLSRRWVDLNDSSSVGSDTPPSPITFARSPSPVKSKLHPLRLSGTNSCSTTPSSTGQLELTHSYSLSEPSLPSSREMPLRVTEYSTSHSVSSDADPPNVVTAKSNWLVPLGTQNDDIIISIARSSASSTQNWTGEWNSDIQDVIQNLRRL